MIEILEDKNDKSHCRVISEIGINHNGDIDIAKKIGTIGHLIKLTRTTVGTFSLDDSLTVEKFEEQWKL